MTLSGLQRHSPTASLSRVIFRTALQQLTGFQITQRFARRAIAELLIVYSCVIVV